MKRVIACIDSSPCINALAEAAAWIAKQTHRELVLLQVLDYYPASYHLGEISGVIGFESNAMLLKELAELEQKQSELALDYSNNLLRHISDQIKEKHNINTINHLRGRILSLNLIPHTAERTNIGTWKAGSQVNLEVDVLARYIERLMMGDKAAETTPQSKISLDFLAENGFLK